MVQERLRRREYRALLWAALRRASTVIDRIVERRYASVVAEHPAGAIGYGVDIEGLWEPDPTQSAEPLESTASSLRGRWAARLSAR